MLRVLRTPEANNTHGVQLLGVLSYRPPIYLVFFFVPHPARGGHPNDNATAERRRKEEGKGEEKKKERMERKTKRAVAR